ncbi:hypothetical protein LCGC14_3054420, partial [marine sediment metagenome]
LKGLGLERPPTTEAWIESLPARSAYQKKLQDIKTSGQTVDRLTAWKKLTGFEGNPELNDTLDTFNRFLDVTLNIIQIARLNEHITGLQEYVDTLRQWSAFKNNRIAVAQERVKQWRRLGKNDARRLAKFLYEELNLPPRYKKGRVTTDEDALDALNAKYNLKVLELIIRMRKMKVLKSTFLDAKPCADGRMRTHYIISGTDTGRLASKDVNLQNVPHGKARSFFLPDEGCKFVGVDLSQAEARIVAYLSEDIHFMKVFEEGRDVHRKNASNIFGIAEEDVTPKQRFLGKKLVHAGNYGIGHGKFSKETGLSYGDSKKALNTYYATYPKLKIWHLKVENTLRKTRVMETPLGRRR